MHEAQSSILSPTKKKKKEVNKDFGLSLAKALSTDSSKRKVADMQYAKAMLAANGR
jgi:hypothetical protein